jgi:hypothetical protein
MSLIQHRDEQVRFQQQLDNARNYVLPFIEQALPIVPGLHVLTSAAVTVACWCLSWKKAVPEQGLNWT